MSRPTKQQLTEGVRDAAANLDALAQDYSASPDTVQRSKRAGVEHAAQLVWNETFRLELGNQTEAEQVRAEMRAEVKRLHALLRRCLGIFSHAEALYDEAADDWQPEIRRYEKLLHDVRRELGLEK